MGTSGGQANYLLPRASGALFSTAERSSSNAKFGLFVPLSCSKAGVQSQRIDMQSEHGLKVYLNDYRDVFCNRYRQQDFRIIFYTLRTRGGVQLTHYLRPVPGHTGRVIRDTTSAPDQAACTISGTIFPQLPLAFPQLPLAVRAGAGIACTARAANLGQLR